MTTTENQNSASSPPSNGAGSAPPENKPEPAAAAPAPAESANRHGREREDEDGPQPGNVARPEPSDEDEYGDGPAPGNEKFPPPRHAQGQGPGRGPRPQGPPREPRPPREPAAGAAGAAPPAGPPREGGSTSSKRRRRRKKGGAGHAPEAGQPHAQAHAPTETDAPAETAETTEGAAAPEPPAEGGSPATEAHAEHAPGRDRDRKKRREHDREHREHRGPRPDRERPAFNVGDIVFGKIVEIGDDAIFVDLAGKGRAIFDRRELDLPDDPTPETQEARDEHDAHEPEGDDAPKGEHTEEHAAEAAAAAEEPATAETVSMEDAPTATGEPENFSPPAVAEKPEAAPEPTALHEEAAAAAPETEAAPVDVAPAPAEAAVPHEKAPPKPREPQAPLPAVILEIGAPFVGMVHNDGGRGGLMVLTRHPRRISKSKQMTSAALKEHVMVFGLVTGVIKGGIEVDVEGLRAFAPGSHMDLRKGADLSPLVGKRMGFHVTQYGKRGRDVVLSRKAMLEADAKAIRDEAIKKLAVGAVVDGIVRSVVPFGAFIDIGGVEGLVPLPEMSHNRSDGPSDVFKPGETVAVKIMKIDDKGKVALSRKAAMPNPWIEVAKKYAHGTKHTGKVARIQPFGVFVELESGVDGLIHTPDLTLKKIEHPSEVVKIGDPIEVVVAHVEASSHRIGLHPAPTGEQANEAPQRVQIHKMVKAVVTNVETGGLVVRILGVTGRSAKGFIPAGGTGTPRGTELRKPFPIGTKVEAKVMEIDPKRGEVKLSIKALTDQTERDAYHEYKKQVSKEARFTFGDLLKKNAPK